MAGDYAGKDPEYFGGARPDFVAQLPADAQARVLELGCSNGATGALALHEGKCGEYVGIEMFAPAARLAAARISRVHEGNVDAMELAYAPGYFDALIMSEVLEHLVDPAATLAKLLPLVRPGGLVMASSPNVAHWRVILGLVKGQFTYAESGVMDRTHLRWFTPASFADMFAQSGVAVRSLGPVTPLSTKQRLLSRLLTARFAHLFYTQICLIGRRI